MWHMGDGWGWWMIAGWIWMLGFWGIVIWGVITLASRTRTPSGGPPERETTPMQLLEERYARGEISHEEFEERRRRLLNRPP